MTRAPVEALSISSTVRTSFLTDFNPSPCPAETLTAEWWKVLEGADLMEFSSNEKQKSVSARWAQLKKKVGKITRGRSEDDDNATNLAIQHWLEAIDATHRYGHNLHVYFKFWEKSDTKEPFFYWLDYGEGRGVDLPDKCRRFKLMEEKIIYLGPKERKPYEVVFVDGKFCYRQTKKNLDGDQMIFVLSTKRKLYVGKKEKGRFQHSSFLAGGPALAAGRLTVKDGDLKCLEAHSGHYRPSEMNFKNFVDLLSSTGVDVTTMILAGSHDESKGRQRSLKRRQSSHGHEMQDAQEQYQALVLNADADNETSGTFFDPTIYTPFV
ncbi:IQ domain-containing protein IQM2-like [Selaginella moellendorffii]|uniref:IQ domain-containing protein IQM2-like n=1 Tax=Selaginella moellendorffii TaxID=88036 RepID=UPI000D1C4D0A|nr:IQ domain-containing protein IQM2-like [Selaginella moellendorffii]|eukprot:XP_024524396.1 IQ domain-containing protein IQM2-like [Selaginella moellendorffii]